MEAEIAEPPTSKLESILKQSLEECVALARRKIRSKKGISELQNILVDYHENEELAAIILNVVLLIAQYDGARRKEAEEPKESVNVEEYRALEAVLQRYEGSVR